MGDRIERFLARSGRKIMVNQGEPKTGGLPRWAPAVRRVLLAAIGVLFVVSIPWYRDGAEPSRWLGLPDWVAVALICYVAVAVLNSAAWLLTEISDGDDDPPGDSR
jgi:hypothetical protein